MEDVFDHYIESDRFGGLLFSCESNQVSTLSLPLQTMTNTKRLLVYIVPVTVLSFSLNIPKFMEVVIYMFKFTDEVESSNYTKIHGCSLSQFF